MTPILIPIKNRDNSSRRRFTTTKANVIPVSRKKQAGLARNKNCYDIEIQKNATRIIVNLVSVALDSYRFSIRAGSGTELLLYPHFIGEA